MDIIIYNPNSRGGNFDYVISLSKELVKHPSVTELNIVLPANAQVPGKHYFKKKLLSDVPPSSVKLISRIYFVWRSIINPFIFYNFIKRKSGFIIFNDYDQATSLFWTFLFRGLRSKFVFSVVLHDPDRDKYFSREIFSTLSMKKVMSIMDVAFYHEILPQKPYYPSSISYESIPHGLYNQSTESDCDLELKTKLNRFKGNSKLISAIGNVRTEKNYELIIRALKEVDDIKLLIYGVPANSSINLSTYLQLAQKEGLQERVLVIGKHFNEQELKAIAEETDAFIIYYARSFKSQSGVLNLLAPLRKMLLVSKTESPLSCVVSKYSLGLMADPDSSVALVKMLDTFKQSKAVNADWEGYFNYASWTNNANSIINKLQAFAR